MKDPLPKSMRAPIGGVLETGFRNAKGTEYSNQSNLASSEIGGIGGLENRSALA